MWRLTPPLLTLYTAHFPATRLFLSPPSLLPRVWFRWLLPGVAAVFRPEMLAAPLQLTSAFNDTDIGTQYRPAKDLQAFNALLPPAIEFVKGSSTGAISAAEGKYQPINAVPPVPAAPGEKSNVSP